MAVRLWLESKALPTCIPDGSELAGYWTNPSTHYWGHVVDIHVAGPYAAIEFVHKERDEVLFACFLRGKDKHISYFSLAAALAGAIAFDYDNDGRAGDFFMRMIMPPEEQ